ncbi:MAG: aspartate ammonia-lyase [Phycisphaerae bacterium]|nr:aspartate ammonia-lyase [Phycisphaerae bacterium]
MSNYRIEHDLLGEMRAPADALWGVHTLRAMENFPVTGRSVQPALIHAYGAVKLACARTNHELGRWDEKTFQALARACEEMIEGKLDEHIVVDALQGGAGTSTNMNVNEVLANRALQILGKPPGEYDTLHPLEDVNLHQSTNDTYPTALKVAAVFGLRDLQREVIGLLEAFQAKEKQFAHVVKVGRTQFQDAVLITLGREMSAHAEALSRDRWRIYKCEERLRVVNLGGMAIGTGLGAPRKFIFQAVEHLRQITSLGLARAENLVEATQNHDAFVEVSGILKALATNLLKIAGDLRLLSSGPEAGFGELLLPAKQAGSSIMPGKVNPVIPEAVSQAALRAIANDQALTQAVSLGSLELNAFLPLIADSLLDTLNILANACRIFRIHCVEGMEANEARCRAHVHGATAAVTALVGKIGYEAAQNVAREATRNGKSIREAAIELGVLTAEEFDELTSPERVMQLGSQKVSDDE